MGLGDSETPQGAKGSLCAAPFVSPLGPKTRLDSLLVPGSFSEEVGKVEASLVVGRLAWGGGQKSGGEVMEGEERD